MHRKRKIASIEITLFLIKEMQLPVYVRQSRGT